MARQFHNELTTNGYIHPLSHRRKATLTSEALAPFWEVMWHKLMLKNQTLFPSVYASGIQKKLFRTFFLSIAMVFRMVLKSICHLDLFFFVFFLVCRFFPYCIVTATSNIRGTCKNSEWNWSGLVGGQKRVRLLPSDSIWNSALCKDWVSLQ